MRLARPLFHTPVAATLTVALALTAVVVLAPVPARAARAGDAGRFDTWAGYDVGRYVEAVAAGDFNGDGAPDAAWARNDWFTGQEPGNSMAIQLNLGEGTMSEAVQLPAQDLSKDIKSADLDGDLDLDLVVVSEGLDLQNAVIDVYLNDGEGSFTHTPAAGGGGPTRLDLADLNGDERPDILTGNYWAQGGSVSVLLNNGDGTFGEEARLDGGSRAYGVVAADLDEDGDRDIAASRQDEEDYSLHIRLFENDGEGAFTRVPGDIVVDVAMGSPTLEEGDIDGDELPDLVAGHGEATVVALNGPGLDLETSTVLGGFTSGGLNVVDYDDDGDTDILSGTFGSSFTGDVSVLLNQGDATFEARRVESSHQPHDVDTADFNRDGLLDMAVPNRGSSTAAIHPQTETGNFASPPVFPTFSAPSNVTVADLDDDGDADVASSQPSPFGSDDAVQVMLNDGVAGLTPGQLIDPSAPEPKFIHAAPLDSDASPDLVWTSQWQPFPVIYALNDGDGTFADPVVLELDGCDTGQVTTADTDDDGDQDILVTIDGTGFEQICYELADSVAVLENAGNGTFGAPTYVQMEYFPYMAEGADLDGDQVTDLVSVGSGQGGERDVSVRLGTGGGAFAEPVHYSVGETHLELSLADLDGDEDIDLVTGDFDNMVTVFLNDGTGTFADITRYQGEEINGLLNQSAIDVGDLNGDGALDIVAANFSGADIGVHYGRGDGTFVRSQIRYGMHSELRDIELAHMNGDGLLDVVGPQFVGGSAGSAGTEQAPRAAPEGGVAGAGLSVLLNAAAGTARCTILGGAGHDFLRGTRGRDVICGLGGDDVLIGGNGQDLLIGGPGRDQLSGGMHADILAGLSGPDILRGGQGPDLLFGGLGQDRLSGVDRLGGNDRLDGGPQTDRCEYDQGDAVRGCP